MAFLAIPYPLTNNTPTHLQELFQHAMIAASLCSTVFSVGSIAIGLIHIRKHRSIVTAEEACDFLTGAHHNLYGLRPLAILWSLPFAFLMWSVVTFSAAVLLFCATTGNLAPKLVLLVLSASMLIWICVTVWYFWKRETQWGYDVEGGEKVSRRMKFAGWLWDLRWPTHLHSS